MSIENRSEGPRGGAANPRVVIAMIFAFFAVPAIYQHRVPFWGILGALIMRGAMIAVGAALIARFSWVIYIFGAFLIIAGVKMLVLKPGGDDLNEYSSSLRGQGVL